MSYEYLSMNGYFTSLQQIKYKFAMFWDTVEEKYEYNKILSSKSKHSKCPVYISPLRMEQLIWNNSHERVKTLK